MTARSGLIYALEVGLIAVFVAGISLLRRVERLELSVRIRERESRPYYSMARETAQYIVNYFLERNNPVTMVKLQALLYFVQRDFLKATGERLFSEKFDDEGFMPRVPEVWYQYSVYGLGPIMRRDTVELCGFEAVIDKTLKKYAEIPPYQLAEMAKNDFDSSKCGEIT